MTREEAAQERIQAATEHIEAAQHEMERACQALSSLNFMQPEGDRLWKLRDRIKAQFYRLSKLSYRRIPATKKATLDREPTADEHGHLGCCPRSKLAAADGIVVDRRETAKGIEAPRGEET